MVKYCMDALCFWEAFRSPPLRLCQDPYLFTYLVAFPKPVHATIVNFVVWRLYFIIRHSRAASKTSPKVECPRRTNLFSLHPAFPPTEPCEIFAQSRAPCFPHFAGAKKGAPVETRTRSDGFAKKIVRGTPTER